MKDSIIKLTAHQLRSLKRQFQLLKFNNDFNLVYESQIPNTGIVLINGELTLFQKKKIFTKIKPGNMLGLRELINNETVDTGCMVMGNSELILIQKSDILYALSNTKSELYAIFKEHIEA
jgi:signal-transduction protein with cAMP-binding, CBS, and nucleotidyltransferase domain